VRLPLREPKHGLADRVIADDPGVNPSGFELACGGQRISGLSHAYLVSQRLLFVEQALARPIQITGTPGGLLTSLRRDSIPQPGAKVVQKYSA